MSEDKNTESFYNPTGQVRMPEAQELANIEATKGQDARIAREGELKKEAESGLTTEEIKNLENMDFLQKEGYPDAFTEIHDGKGRKILGFKGSKRDETTFLTQYGIFQVGGGIAPTVEEYDLTEIMNTVEKGLSENVSDKANFLKRIEPWRIMGAKSVFKKESSEFRDFNTVSVRRVDPADMMLRNEIHAALQFAQATGERSKLKNGGSIKPSSSGEVPRDL